MPRESLCKSSSYQHRVLCHYLIIGVLQDIFILIMFLKLVSMQWKHWILKYFLFILWRCHLFILPAKPPSLNNVTRREPSDQICETVEDTAYSNRNIHPPFFPSNFPEETIAFCAHLHTCNFCCVSELFLLEKEIFDDVKVSKIFLWLRIQCMWYVALVFQPIVVAGVCNFFADWEGDSTHKPAV